MTFAELPQEKQNRIINAACEIFARHGYKKASMNDIAETAGVSKSVLFKYFATKQNLYQMVFHLASAKITAADDSALASSGTNADLFMMMRLSGQARLSLFKEFPWIYKFAYTAAFDADDFVRGLVMQQMDAYRQHQKENSASPTGLDAAYQNLRADIEPAQARQIIFWTMQGFLEDRLYQNNIDPDKLVSDFEAWVDVLEVLFRKSKT